MKHFLQKHRILWTEALFLVDIALGLLLLALSISATYYANSYTLAHASNPVTDIILDNIPTVNVDFFFSTGALIFVIMVVIVCLWEPKSIPFVLKTSALFFLIRSIFMVLTHLAPPDNALAAALNGGDFIHKLSSGDDLFFSAHTGLPFLYVFVFWKQKFLRVLFLICTGIGAVIVLLGHLHYSIDVFSAFFITFGIFHIAQKLFRKDYERLIAPPVAQA